MRVAVACYAALVLRSAALRYGIGRLEYLELEVGERPETLELSVGLVPKLWIFRKKNNIYSQHEQDIAGPHRTCVIICDMFVL